MFDIYWCYKCIEIMYLAPHSGTIWDIYAIEPVMNEMIIKAIILKFF